MRDEFEWANHNANHNANQYISAQPPPTDASRAAHRVKEQSVSGTNAPFFVSWVYVCECVLNFNRRMCVVVFLFISIHLDLTFPHTVSFNCIVSRLLLSVTAARGAPLSDYDADQRAMGWPGAGGTICACKIPHAHCLEVRPSTFPWTLCSSKIPKLND